MWGQHGVLTSCCDGARTYQLEPANRWGATPGPGRRVPRLRALLRRCSTVVDRFFLACLRPLSLQLVALRRGVACRSCGETVVGGFTLIREGCLTPKTRPVDSMSRGSMRPAIGRKEASNNGRTTVAIRRNPRFRPSASAQFWRILEVFPQWWRATPRSLRDHIGVKRARENSI